MNINSLLSEDLALVGVLDPDSFNAGEALTPAIDMKNIHRLMAILALGDRAAGSTVAFNLQAAATSGGSYSEISGKAITTISDTSPLSGASNKQYIINLRGEEVTSNQQYVKAGVTLVGSPSATELSVIVLAQTRIRPASDYDLASVLQIIS